MRAGGRGFSLALALAWASLLAGCGGGDDDSNAPATTTSLSPVLALSIAEPANGAAALDTRVLVAGTMSAGAQRVTVNGQEACVAGTRFFLNDADIAGATSLVAVASSGSNSATAAVRVAKPTRPKALRVSGDACGRQVPYRASFDLAAQGFPAEAIAAVEADLDGDGIIDYNARALPKRIPWVYAKAGVFRARFTVILADGSRLDTYRYQSAMASTEPIALPKDTVLGLSEALKAKDTSKALSYFTAEAQARHGWALTALQSQLAELGNGMTAARLPAPDEQQARYEITVNHGDSPIVFNIVLIKDESGAWKVDSL